MQHPFADRCPRLPSAVHCCQRTYDAALRAHNHPDAGSKTGDNLTEAAYAAGHRVEEAAHKVGDAVSGALGLNKAGAAPVTTSETNQSK